MTEFPSVLRLLIRRWPILVLGLALGLTAGLAANKIMRDSFRARTFVLIVADKRTDSPTAVAVDYAQAYSRVAVTPTVLDQAFAEMGITRDLDEARREIQVEASPNVPLLDITATADNPQVAADLANAVRRGLSAYGNTRARQTGYRVQLFTPAVPPLQPSSPNRPVNLALGAILGLLLGGLACLAMPSGQSSARRRARARGDRSRVGQPPPLAPLGRPEWSTDPAARPGGGEVTALTTSLAAARPTGSKVSDKRAGEEEPFRTPPTSEESKGADAMAPSQLVGERMPTIVARFLEGRDDDGMAGGSTEAREDIDREPFVALTPESMANCIQLASMIEQVNKMLQGQRVSLYDESLPQAEAEECAAWFNLDTVAILLDNGDGLLKVAGAVGLSKRDQRKTVPCDNDVIQQMLRAGLQVVADGNQLRLSSVGIRGRSSRAGLITVPLGPPEAPFGVLVAGLRHHDNGAVPTLTSREADILEAFGRTIAPSLQVWIELRRLKSQLERVE